jgi:three-Cys-motif partner protein
MQLFAIVNGGKMLAFFKRPLAEKLGPLFKFKYLNDLEKIYPAIYYPANHWTPLKLACLYSYLHTCFIPIQGKRKIKEKLNIYFVDLLSNSGINKIDRCKNCEFEKDSKECLRKKCRVRQFYKDSFIGSPIVASIAEIPFDKMYFVDKAPSKCVALKKRLGWLKSKPEYEDIKPQVMQGDCNVVVNDIFKDIGPKNLKFYSILAFIDNEGLDVHWGTIAKLSNKYSDLIINFPTAQIKREFEAAKTGRSHEKLDLFFGEKNILDKCTKETLLNYYVKKLKEMGRPVWTIDIRAGDLSFHYHLIIAVKKGRPSFSKFIDGIKKFESYDSKDIEKDIDILFGRSKTLLDFL